MAGKGRYMCAAQKGLQELRLREKSSPVSAHALWQEQAHFRQDSTTECVSVSFQLTFPVRRADFPVRPRHQAPYRCTQRHRALLLLEPFRSITMSKALAVKLKHLAPGQFSSSQKFIISDGKYAQSPWIWFWATRYRCSCTCCKGREQDSKQTTHAQK